MNQSRIVSNSANLRSNSPLTPETLKRTVALGMIGVAVVCSYFLTPLPVAAGLTILAGLRLWIVVREERKAGQNRADS